MLKHNDAYRGTDDNTAPAQGSNGVKIGKGMGRKPTAETHDALGHTLPQEAIWRLVRQLKSFDIADIEIAAINQTKGKSLYSGLSSATIKSYLIRLTRGGYLKQEVQVLKGNQRRARWHLINDCGSSAPSLTKAGKPSSRGKGYEQLWRSIKILKSFNYLELVAASDSEQVHIAPSTAKNYIHHLYKAGYLRLVQAHRPGTAARYCKIPFLCIGKAPMITRNKQVFDQNKLQVVSATPCLSAKRRTQEYDA